MVASCPVGHYTQQLAVQLTTRNWLQFDVYMFLKASGIASAILPVVLWCISPFWWHALRIGVPGYSFEAGLVKDGVSLVFNTNPQLTFSFVRLYGDWAANPIMLGKWIPDSYDVQRGWPEERVLGFIRSTSSLSCHYKFVIVPHWLFTSFCVFLGLLLYGSGVRRSRMRDVQPGGFQTVAAVGQADRKGSAL
jgi:hypothetical protein